MKALSLRVSVRGEVSNHERNRAGGLFINPSCFTAPEITTLKQDKYHMVFCNDLGTKTVARSTALDTFYPFRPSKRVIIIHTSIALSRKTWGPEQGKTDFYKPFRLFGKGERILAHPLL